MKGYGRWLALSLFLALIFFSMLEQWKNDRDMFWISCLLFILIPIGSVLIFGTAYFIFNYW